MTKPNPALQDHDHPSERALLGACLYGAQEAQEVLDEIAEVVPNEAERVELFDDRFCAALYQAIKSLDLQGTAITVHTVEQELRKQIFLSGHASFTQLSSILPNLQQIISSAAPPSLAAHYAEQLHALYVYRKLKLAAAAMTNTVQQTPPTTTRQDAEQLVARVEDLVLEVRDRAENASRTETASRIAVELSEHLEHEMQNQLPRGRLHAGFEPLDRALHLTSGRVVVLAGRPGSGKSALAGFLTCQAALNRIPSFYISLEMNRTDVAQRMVAGMSGCAWDPYGGEELTRRYSEAVARFAQLPLWIDDSYSLTINTIAARIRRLKRRHELQLAVVDYLQLIRASGRYHSRENEVAAISRALKVIAGENEIALILLSQLNREPEKNRTQSRVPRMSDLRESGAIEQDADVVALLHQPDEDCPDPDHTPLDVIVDKNRTGRTGVTRLTFHKNTSSFELRSGPGPAAALLTEPLTEDAAPAATQLSMPLPTP